jgi:hypothetical protein
MTDQDREAQDYVERLVHEVKDEMDVCDFIETPFGILNRVK